MLCQTSHLKSYYLSRRNISFIRGQARTFGVHDFNIQPFHLLSFNYDVRMTDFALEGVVANTGL